MEQLDEIKKFNSIALNAFSSLQKSLDIIYQYPLNEQSISILVETLFCSDPNICNEKTKYISMKILTNFFDQFFSDNISERLENFYEIYFKSDFYNDKLITSIFSIDLFASVFKYNPSRAFEILNNFFSMDNDRYGVVVLYTIRFVKKIRTTKGFENILFNIFQHLPEMTNEFNEMLSIIPIVQLFLPFIISQKTHLLLFKYYETNEHVCKTLQILLQYDFLFEKREVFDEFAFEYISVFSEIITNNHQLLWKTNLLLDLRQKDSFRKLPFNQFFIELIEKIYSSLEFSFETSQQSIDIISNFLTFFENIDQLYCNSSSEEAFVFNKETMNNCRKLILNNIPKIQINGNDIIDLNSPFLNFFEHCAKLFIRNYTNCVESLISINSLSSFLIIKEMVLEHENKPINYYSDLIEIDKNSLISFIKIENKPIEVTVIFLTAYIKIYPDRFFFTEEYFQAMIMLIQDLQRVKTIDLLILQKAIDFIDKITIIDENKLSFLINNPLFPFIVEENNRKEMRNLFKKISSLSFIDQIIDTIFSIPDLNPEIIIDYSMEAPLGLIFGQIIPEILKRFSSAIDPLNIVNFIYRIINRLKTTLITKDDFMSEPFLSSLHILCQILSDFSNKNEDSFYVQQTVLKSLTTILQLPALNLGVCLFFNDLFIVNLILDNFKSLDSLNIEIICSDLSFIIDFFKLFKTDAYLLNTLVNDNMIALFLKITLFLVQKDEFNFDLLKDIFEINIMMIESNRILGPVESLTDNILNRCIYLASKQELPYTMYITISYLSKFHPDLFSSTIASICSNSEIDNDQIKKASSKILTGTKDEIVDASKFYFRLLTNKQDFQT